MKTTIKSKLGHYLFEISVIFIGITLSFLFEEWRTSRKEKATTKGHLAEIREEAVSIKTIVSIYDSTIEAESSRMDSLFNLSNPTNRESFELIRYSVQNKDFSISYIQSELSTLKSTGEVGLLDRHIIFLLELIQVAIDKIEKYQGNQSIHDQLIQLIIQKTTLSTDLTSDNLKTDYALLIKSDVQLRELINWKLREKKIPLYNLNLLKERCDALMEMVDQELMD